MASDKSALEAVVLDLRENNAGLARKLAKCGRRCRAFGRTSRRGSVTCPSVCSSDAGSVVSSDGGEDSSDEQNDEKKKKKKAGHDDDDDTAATMDALQWSARVKDAQVRDLTLKVQASYEFIAILREQNEDIAREKDEAERRLADTERATSDYTPVIANGRLRAATAMTCSSLGGPRSTTCSSIGGGARDADDCDDEQRLRVVAAAEREATLQRGRAERAEAERDALAADLIKNRLQQEETTSPAPASNAPTEVPRGNSPPPPSAERIEREKAAAEARASELRERLSGSEEELRRARQDIAALRKSAAAAAEVPTSGAAAAPVENFDAYYEPAVKNLQFLLKMRDFAVKDAKAERDEALREAELLRERNEQLRTRRTTGAGPAAAICH